MMKSILSSIKLGALFGCLLVPSFAVMAANADTHNLTVKSDTHKTSKPQTQKSDKSDSVKQAEIPDTHKSQSQAEISDTHKKAQQSRQTSDDEALPEVLKQKPVVLDNGPAAISAQKQAEIDQLVGQKLKQPIVPEDKKELENKALKDKNKLDQGTIDAQIEDVLGSQEFIELEKSEVFSTSKKNANKNKKNESEPEATLLQLDQSDLMDYVAEDDFWKEQLTIEDEPG